MNIQAAKEAAKATVKAILACFVFGVGMALVYTYLGALYFVLNCIAVTFVISIKTVYDIKVREIELKNTLDSIRKIELKNTLDTIRS